MRQINFRLPEPDAHRLEEIAARESRTVPNTVVHIVLKFLEDADEAMERGASRALGSDEADQAPEPMVVSSSTQALPSDGVVVGRASTEVHRTLAGVVGDLARHDVDPRFKGGK